MATQVRSKPAKKAPVTQHPLFPAMVALWFGALFGLGSLAVRSSLIEDLVLRLSLDVILPAAAPPLGIKFRLILALVMAASGVAIGAVLARRIARPKPVDKPRNRGFGSKLAGRNAAVPVEEAAPRRRPLTVETSEPVEEFADAAPLPGSAPAILDVTQIDLDSLVAETHETLVEPYEVPAPSYDASPVPAEPAAEATLAAPFSAPIAQEPAAEPESERQTFRQPAAEPEIWQEAKPVELAAQPAEPTKLSFHPPASVLAAQADAQDDIDDLGEFAEHDLADEAPVAEALEPADDYASQLDGLRNAGSTFAAPVEAAREQAEEVAVVEAIAVEPAPLVAESETADAEPVPAAAPALPVIPAILTGEWKMEADEPEAEPAVHAEPAEVATIPPYMPEARPASLFEAQPTRRIEQAQLSELSPVELIERLAMAMRQRAHSGPMPTALAEAVASLAPQAEPAADGAEPEAIIADEPVAAAAVIDEAEALEAAPVPQPVEAAAEAIAAEPAVETPAEPAAEPSIKRLVLPAAMRPIDFSDYGDPDDGDPVIVPPRSFVAMAPAAPAESASETPLPAQIVPELDLASLDVAVELASESVVDAATALIAESEAPIPEESYSSLLDLGRPATARQDFVRIEEPEDETVAIQPVVIFPGHAAKPGRRFAAPGSADEVAANPANHEPQPSFATAPAAQQSFAAPAPAPAAPQLRRFDAPATSAAPVAGAFGADGIRQDPEEAQRALRSALATLQRMSGAA